MTDGELLFHPPDQSPDEHFATAIKGIINTAVTIRNVNFFAHRALSNLITVIDDVRLEYSQSPTIAQDTLRDTETSAFNYFRLTNIEDILGHVERKVEQLDDIDQLIRNANVLEDVIIPPVRPTEGSGEEIEREPDEEPEFQRRLKTVLFLIANEFGIGINDPTQLGLSTGIVPDTITRERSYYAIEVPSISRIVFVCDQKGNVTYVFDRAKAISEGADMETLAGFTKPELNELLIQHPGIGRRVTFSNNYVPGMVGALKNKLDDKGFEVATRSYLTPEDRLQYTSLSDMCRALVVGEDRLRKLIREVEDFGEVAFSRHGYLYTHVQQEKLRRALEERGEYAPRPDKDELSLVSIARILGIEKKKAEALVCAARSEIGEPKMKKFGAFVREAFNGKDLEAIEDKIPELYPPNLEAFPGHLTINGIHNATGIGMKTIESLVKEVEAKDNDLRAIKVSQRGRRLMVYSPEFQAEIKKLIGPFVEGHTDDLMTIHAFAESLGLGANVIKTAYKNNIEKIGELTKKGVTERGSHSYLSKAQQNILKSILTETGRFAEVAPEGYLSASRLAERLRLAPATLKDLVETCAEELGELKSYKFFSNVTVGYSPEQQDILRRHL